jgi:DNA-binding response OmpR family regulator
MADNKGPILVIDDEAEACEFIKSFLEERDYSVITALNGHNGIEAIKNKKPSLVFLDMRMPDMSGLDVLSKLKEDGVTAKIILMTAIDEEAEIEKARQLGVIGLLKKPIQMTELSETVKQNI